MLPESNALTFALAAFAIIIIPGPSVLFVIGRSLAYGRRAGVLSVVGNALGMLPAITLVSLGVGAIVAESLVIFTIVKLVGAAYLVYLGVQTIRHRRDHLDPAAVKIERMPTLRLLREGFVVGVANPKTIAFFLAVLPQFVDARGGAIQAQLAELGLIFFVIAIASDSVWAVAAGTARAWFGRSPSRLSRLRAGGGVMMIGLGGALALTSTKN